MYKLSEETKKILSKNIGIPYEKLIKMDQEEITAYIEQKNAKKITPSEPDPRFTGSGDDSVLIDMGRFITTEEVNDKIDEIISHHKLKKQKNHTNNQEDTLLSK